MPSQRIPRGRCIAVRTGLRLKETHFHAERVSQVIGGEREKSPHTTANSCLLLSVAYVEKVSARIVLRLVGAVVGELPLQKSKVCLHLGREVSSVVSVFVIG